MAADPNFWVALGQRPGQLDGPIELLRQPVTLQGLDQSGIYSPSMANGRLAYVDGYDAPHRAWIEDQLIAETGDSIVGTAGWSWQTFYRVVLATSGDLLIFGSATVPGSSTTRDLIWRWPQRQPLLLEGQSLTGFGTASRLGSSLTVSPNGEHWSIALRNGAGRNVAVVVDGQILEVTPGRPAVVGSAVASGIAGAYGPSLWERFQGPAELNDRGDYAIAGDIETLSGSLHQVTVRNGRTVLDSTIPRHLQGIDARGAIFGSTYGRLLIEKFLIASQTDEVDVDGDGVPDPAFGLCALNAYNSARPGPDSLTLSKARLRGIGGCSNTQDVIVRARPMRVDLPVCEGVLNSTGAPGQLVLGGSSQVAENEVSLQLFGLPEGAPCYAILSRSAGFVANPGGSQGNLCLSGGIGRMVLSLFQADAEGLGEVALDLTALREPNGYVAGVPGERWFFQAWYRDSVAGMATSNFTSASVLVLD